MQTERLLAIESSSSKLSIAAGTETQVLKEYQGPLAWRHAESLFDGLDHLLAEVRWSVQSLSGVVASVGPGSFTGIRIGLAVARALGQSLAIPLAGVSSLEAIAYRAAKPGHWVCACLDALRGDVFAALYWRTDRNQLRRVWKEQRMPLEVLRTRLRSLDGKVKSLWIAGDAIEKYGPALSEAVGGTNHLLGRRYWHPRAGALLALGAPRLGTLGKNSYRQVFPLYLRQAAAQERYPRNG